MKIKYDKEVDALYIELKKSKVSKTVERGSNIIIDYDDKHQPIGIEILNYSKINPKKEKLEVSAGEKKILIPA